MSRVPRSGIVALVFVVLILIGAQMVSVPSALAASIDNLFVTCKWVLISGKTDVRAPSVRIQDAHMAYVLRACSDSCCGTPVSSICAYMARRTPGIACSGACQASDRAALTLVAYPTWPTFRPCGTIRRECWRWSRSPCLPRACLEPSSRAADAIATPRPATGRN